MIGLLFRLGFIFWIILQVIFGKNHEEHRDPRKWYRGPHGEWHEKK
jgi:hypothetical protein